MSTLNQLETKWTLGAFVLATVAGIAIPAYFIAENKVTKAGKNTIAVAPDAKLLGGVILVLCAIGFVALWKRKRTLVAFDLFLVGFAFTLFVGLIGFAFIVARRVAHAPGLAAQQVRHHQFQSHRPGGRSTPAGTGAQRSRSIDIQDGLDADRPQTAHGQQALHAQGPRSEEDPQADRVGRRPPSAGLGDAQGPQRLAGSIRSAERSSRSASVRRRTSDRAVGSSPSARSTSTSVTIPMTVE